VPSDKSISQPDVYAKAANGDTAAGYYTDGRYNIGGWATYPSADELAISTVTPAKPTSPKNIPQ
jgi:hypothetical protein